MNIVKRKLDDRKFKNYSNEDLAKAAAQRAQEPQLPRNTKSTQLPFLTQFIMHIKIIRAIPLLWRHRTRNNFPIP